MSQHRFLSFSGIPAGTYGMLRFTKAGYEVETMQVQVPGGTPSAFDIEFTRRSRPAPPITSTTLKEIRHAAILIPRRLCRRSAPACPDQSRA